MGKKVKKHEGKFLAYYEQHFVTIHGKDGVWEMIG